MSAGDEGVSDDYIGFMELTGTTVARLKWTGGLEQLQAAIDRPGRVGNWTEAGDTYVYRAIEGGVLTWYPKTKTVLIQGSDEGFAASVEAQIVTPKSTLDLDD